MWGKRFDSLNYRRTELVRIIEVLLYILFLTKGSVYVLEIDSPVSAYTNCVNFEWFHLTRRVWRVYKWSWLVFCCTVGEAQSRWKARCLWHAAVARPLARVYGNDKRLVCCNRKCSFEQLPRDCMKRGGRAVLLALYIYTALAIPRSTVVSALAIALPHCAYTRRYETD